MGRKLLALQRREVRHRSVVSLDAQAEVAVARVQVLQLLLQRGNLFLQLASHLRVGVIGDHLDVEFQETALGWRRICGITCSVSSFCFSSFSFSQIGVHRLIGLDLTLLARDIVLCLTLGLLRVDELCVCVVLHITRRRQTNKGFASDRLLELTETLLWSLRHEVGHTILRQKLAEVAQIDL